MCKSFKCSIIYHLLIWNAKIAESTDLSGNHLTILCVWRCAWSPPGRCQRKEGSSLLDFNIPAALFSQVIGCLLESDNRLFFPPHWEHQLSMHVYGRVGKNNCLLNAHFACKSCIPRTHACSACVHNGELMVFPFKNNSSLYFFIGRQLDG